MRYQGSEAVDLDALERRAPATVEEPRPSFGVVEGAGLDAKVRAGVSAQFMRRVKLVLTAVCVVVILGMARVGIASATVSVLQDNQSLRSTIKTSQATENELKVNRSVLSASSRIVRIATENYGMALASSTDEMSLSDDTAASDAAQAEDSDETSDAASSASDGDATQDGDSPSGAATES